MIRQEQLVAAYQAYGNANYFGAASAAPLAASRMVAADEAKIGGVQAAPSVKVSLSQQGLELSRNDAGQASRGSALERPDSQVFATQTNERHRSNARFHAHSAQLNAEAQQVSAARDMKWQARGQAHDVQKKQELDAQTAAADQKRQAENRVPLPAPQVRPMAEGVKELSDAAAQNNKGPAVQPLPPPEPQKG